MAGRRFGWSLFNTIRQRGIGPFQPSSSSPLCTYSFPTSLFRSSFSSSSLCASTNQETKVEGEEASIKSSQISPRERLPRWANLKTATGVLRGLDYSGTLFFSASGALTAAYCGCDVFGCLAIGTITAVGGGTLRDVVVLRKQPFWFEEWEYLVMSLVAAAGVFFLWPSMQGSDSPFALKSTDGGEGRLMDFGDALGLGAFAVIGTMNGIRVGAPWLVSAICGMMTCTFGGLTRDTLLNRPVRILHPYADVYAPVAFVGSLFYLCLRTLFPAAQPLRIALTVSLVVGLRAAALTFGWRLPWWDPSTHQITSGNRDPRSFSPK